MGQADAPVVLPAPEYKLFHSPGPEECIGLGFPAKPDNYLLGGKNRRQIMGAGRWNGGPPGHKYHLRPGWCFIWISTLSIKPEIFCNAKKRQFLTAAENLVDETYSGADFPGSLTRLRDWVKQEPVARTSVLCGDDNSGR